MMLIRLAILSYGLITSLLCADYHRVTMQVTAPGLPDSVQVYITGNHRLLGNWRPDRCVLKSVGNSTYTRSFRLRSHTKLEFKFTLGSWETEARDSIGKVMPNFNLEVSRDTLLSFTFFKWGEQKYSPEQLVQRGSLQLHHQVKGAGLRPRDIAVWLPPGYNDNPHQRYPVLYMHDGQNLFADQLAAFGIEWRADETADSLIRNQLIPPIIIVGIYNTSDRSREYGPTRLGRAYRRFLIDTVKPLVDSLYRTLPDREHTATGGSSMGGLVAFMLLWENPEVFSKAICMSPAFKIARLDYVKTVRRSRSVPQKIRLYIDNGGLDLEARLQPGIDAMLTVLQELGLVSNCDYFWQQDSEAAHNEAAWARRLPQALQFIFPLQP